MHGNKSLARNDGHYEVNEYGPDPARTGLNQLQARVILGALTSRVATAKDVLKPKASVFSLTADTLVDQDLLKKLRETGFSRVPIFLNEEGANRNAVVGVLLTKSLVGLQAPAADADSDDDSKHTLADLMKSEQIKVVEPVYVTPESSLDSIFAMFR